LVACSTRSKYNLAQGAKSTFGDRELSLEDVCEWDFDINQHVHAIHTVGTVIEYVAATQTMTKPRLLLAQQWLVI
jgi:hypothetical protein